MLFEDSNYRTFLKRTLVERKKKNVAYSMRAFGMQIGMKQSALSQVLSGKKNLSAESATRIAAKLNLSEDEAEYFRTLVQLEAAKNPDLKKSLATRMQTLNPKHAVRELSVEYFSMIADWHHLAIKNMVDLDSFEFKPTAIARRLGISAMEAEMAIDRLVRLEVIEPDPTRPKRYRRAQPYTVTRSTIPNEALRRFHRQMLEKAIEALGTQTPKEKIVGSETLAVPDKALAEANRLIEEFFNKMTALSALPGKKKHVYHLGVQFFNLTQNPRSGEKSE